LTRSFFPSVKSELKTDARTNGARKCKAKNHPRIKERRIKRIKVTPEEMGFCGAWQIIAVERTLADPKNKSTPWTKEISYYITSLPIEEVTNEKLMEIITGHWAAIENGTHYVRDKSFGEDGCRISNPNGARNMVVMRNLTLGLYNLERHRKKTKATSLQSWRRSMKATEVINRLKRK
jgi:predicted transposase YbfD/YdcC